MKYITDSYAWIEYLMGTKAGEKTKPIIEDLEKKTTRGQQFVTPLWL